MVSKQENTVAALIDDLGVALAATDTGAARIFAEMFAPTTRYVLGLGWFVWRETELGGGYWAEDKGSVAVSAQISNVAAAYLEAAASLYRMGRKDEGDKLARFSTTMLNNGRKNAVLAEASRHPALFHAEYPFDREPFYLNTQNGVVDLRTGGLRRAEPALMCSRITSAAYDPNARAERWSRFLGEVFGGDKELIAFARRWLGYCLTASNKEQRYLIAWGRGSNGKSTLFETVLGVLGDYATALRPDVIAVRRDGGDVPTPALAELVGRRLVVLPEWVRGKQVDEVLIKSLVGGDTVQGRRLYSPPFTFKATAKLVIYGNAKPELKGRDWGTWRRVLLLPFMQRFGTGALPADPNLMEQLNEERDGILADLVQAATEWNREGLAVPRKVAAATAQYRDEIDDVCAFVKGMCIVKQDARARLRDLFDAYAGWGGELADARQLSRALRDLGFVLKRGKDGTVVLGVELQQ